MRSNPCVPCAASRHLTTRPSPQWCGVSTLVSSHRLSLPGLWEVTSESPALRADTLPLDHHRSGVVCPPWCLPTNCHYQGGVPGHHGPSRLDGLVVQGLPGEQKAWGSNPTLTRWSPTSVFNMGTLVASLPDAWLGRGCAKNGWPGVRLGEIAPLTCNLSVSVAVCTTVESAPSQRYALLAAGSFSRQASKQPAVFIYLQCPLASTWGHTHLYCDAAHFSASSAIACNFLSSTSVFQ